LTFWIGSKPGSLLFCVQGLRDFFIQNAGVTAGTQERTLEFILDKKGYDSLMNSSMNQAGSKGIDAIKYNFEGINSGSGLRNIGVPSTQLDLFNSLIKNIR
jgi:filamentous hemagglutinin